MWEANAKIVEWVYGMYVDWEERFYYCPYCGELVYECDWDGAELAETLCPICETPENFDDYEYEEEEE